MYIHTHRTKSSRNLKAFSKHFWELSSLLSHLSMIIYLSSLTMVEEALSPTLDIMIIYIEGVGEKKKKKITNYLHHITPE